MKPTPRTPRTLDNDLFPSNVYVGSREGRSDHPTRRSGLCGKADALTVARRIPNGHVEQHWIFVKCPQRRDNRARLRVVNGFDEVWDLLRKPFDSPIRKRICTIHDPTVSGTLRTRKIRTAVTPRSNAVYVLIHWGLILVRDLFGQPLPSAAERQSVTFLLELRSQPCNRVSAVAQTHLTSTFPDFKKEKQQERATAQENAMRPLWLSHHAPLGWRRHIIEAGLHNRKNTIARRPPHGVKKELRFILKLLQLEEQLTSSCMVDEVAKIRDFCFYLLQLLDRNPLHRTTISISGRIDKTGMFWSFDVKP